jgi:hypothetical protein
MATVIISSMREATMRQERRTEAAPCLKRGYASARAARAAHGRANFRIRVYMCRICGKFHATNPDKALNSAWVGAGGGYLIPGQLAPTMTLEELQAEARRRRGLN